MILVLSTGDYLTYYLRMWTLKCSDEFQNSNITWLQQKQRGLYKNSTNKSQVLGRQADPILAGSFREHFIK